MVQNIRVNTVKMVSDNISSEVKHRLHSSIPSVSVCKEWPANLVVARWTANQRVPDTKKISAKKLS